MAEIVASCPRTSTGGQGGDAQQHTSQGNEVGDQRHAPSHSRIAKKRRRTPQQGKPTECLHNRSRNDARFAERADGDACMLNGAEEEERCICYHGQSSRSFHADTSDDRDGRATTRGSMNPVAISQMKLGNLTSGIRNNAFGAITFSQLSSPHTEVDELETKGIVERRRSTEDRRNYALHLTARGHQVLGQLSRVAAEHDESLCAALSKEERVQLRDLCRRIAEEQGLTPGVHPGYRHLGTKR